MTRTGRQDDDIPGADLNLGPALGVAVSAPDEDSRLAPEDAVALVRVWVKVTPGDVAPCSPLLPGVRLKELGHLVLGQRQGEALPVNEDRLGAIWGVCIGPEEVGLGFLDHLDGQRCLCGISSNTGINYTPM